MKKNKVFIAVGIILLVLVVLIFGEGVSILSPNFIYTTKFYRKPAIAFEREVSGVNIEEDISIYSFDENNCFYIALTSDSDLLVSKMYTKNNRYFYAGTYYIISLDNIKEGSSGISYTTAIYNNRGQRESKITWGTKVVKNKVEGNDSNLIYTHTLNDVEYYIYIVIE